MKKSLSFLSFICLEFASVASPHDCIMTPVKQQVRATQYLITGVATTNLDATTSEGKEYRWLLRNLTRQDSLKHCITASFTINSVLKGHLRATEVIEVVAAQSETPKFEIGKRYVLFLRREGERFFVYPCSYSSELNHEPTSAKLLRDISAAL